MKFVRQIAGQGYSIQDTETGEVFGMYDTQEEAQTVADSLGATSPGSIFIRTSQGEFGPFQTLEEIAACLKTQGAETEEAPSSSEPPAADESEPEPA